TLKAVNSEEDDVAVEIEELLDIAMRTMREEKELAAMRKEELQNPTTGWIVIEQSLQGFR
ncbi:hypothetical protein KI387_015845, partial [Taxus chinensis]